MTHVEFKLSAIADYTEFVDHCVESGDANADRECKDRIHAGIEDGNLWAWASVRVSARIEGAEGIDHLCGCSYKDEDDFRKDAYYLDMKGEALAALRSELEDALYHAECDLAAEREAYDKRQARTECWRCPHCKDVVAVEPDYDDIPYCADCDIQRDRYDLVDVVFLRDTEDGDVFAVFPGEAASIGNPDHVTCYSHIGQHSGADLDYCAECDEVSAPSGYADLSTELDRQGYNLRVVRKNCIGDSKYTDSRLEQLQM